MPPPAAPTLYLFGPWGSRVVDPQAWGLGLRPVHEFVVREATTRRQVLHRISKGEARPLDPLRLAIWADTTHDQRSGLRALRARWQSRAAAAGTGTGVLGKRPRGEPDPSSYAVWMRPSRQRPAPWRYRKVPALEPAIEPALSQGPPSDTVDAAAPAAGHAAPCRTAACVEGDSHFPS